MAVEVGEAVRALAEEATVHLRGVLRGRPGLRFTRPVDLHVTLAFLGELEAERLAALDGIVAAVAATHASIDAEVGGLGAFPRSESARVLWLGFGAENPALLGLVADLHARLRTAGHSLESRPWSGHVTLARCRSRGGVDVRTAFASGPDRRVVCRVESIVVMESRPRADGGHYTPIFRALLSGGARCERV
ncbi:MAG: RNA 2',3'-cyclic phosphodiesterase [Myxococcota bacterium]